MAINVGSVYFDALLKTQQLEKQVAAIEKKRRKIVYEVQAKANTAAAEAKTKSFTSKKRSLSIDVVLSNVGKATKQIASFTAKSYKVLFDLTIGNLAKVTGQLARFASSAASTIGSGLAKGFDAGKSAAIASINFMKSSLSTLGRAFRSAIPDKFLVNVTLGGLDSARRAFVTFAESLGFVLRDVLINVLEFFGNRVRDLIAVPIDFAKQSLNDFKDVSGVIEQSLAKIANVTSGNRDSARNALTDAIVEVSGSTITTPKQLAELTDILAQAGRTNEEIISLLEPIGVGSFALNRSTANLAGDVALLLDSFALDATAGESILSAIAATTTSANLNANQLAESIKYFRSQQAGLEGIRNTMGVIALAAAGGLQGSRAGTNLNRLFSQSIKAAEEVKETFGVEVKDDQGNLRGEVDIIRDLTQSYRKLAEERGTAFAIQESTRLFQVQGSRALTSISKIGDNFDRVIAGVDKGFTQVGNKLEGNTEQFEKLRDASQRGITGAFLEMGNKLDSFRFNLGQKIAPIVEGIVRSFSKIVQIVSETEGLLDNLAQSAKGFFEALQTEAIQKSLDEAGAILGGALKSALDFIAGKIEDITELLLKNPSILVNIANKIIEISTSLINLTVGLAAIATKLAEFIIALGKIRNLSNILSLIAEQIKTLFSVFVAALTAGLDDSVLSARTLENIIVGLGTALRPVAALFGAISGTIIAIVQGLAGATATSGFESLANSLTRSIIGIGAAVQRTVTSITSVLSGAVGGFSSGLLSSSAGGRERLGSAVSGAASRSPAPDLGDVEGISNLIGSKVGEALDVAFTAIARIIEQVERSGSSIESVFDSMASIVQQVFSVVAEIAVAIARIGASLLPTIVSTVTEVASSVLSIIRSLVAFLSRGDVQRYLQTAISLIGDLFMRIADFISQRSVQSLLSEAIALLVRAFGILVNQVIPTVMELAVDIAPTILRVAGAVLSVIQRIIPLAVRIVVEIANLVDRYLPSVLSIVNTIISLVSSNLGSIVSLINSVLSFAISVLPKILPVIASIIGYAANLATKFLPVIVQIATSLINILSSNLGNIVALIELILNVSLKAIAAVLSFFENPSIQRILNQIVSVVVEVGTSLSDLIIPLVSTALSAVQSIVRILPPAINAISSGLSPVVESVKTILAGLGAAGKGFASTATPGLERIQQQIPSLKPQANISPIGDFSSSASSFGASIGVAVGKFLEVIAIAIEKMKALSDSVGNLGSQISSIVNSIKGTITEIWKIFGNIISAIGFSAENLTGLASTTLAVLSAAKSIGTAITSIVESLAVAISHSSIFRDVFSSVSQMILDGINLFATLFDLISSNITRTSSSYAVLTQGILNFTGKLIEGMATISSSFSETIAHSQAFRNTLEQTFNLFDTIASAVGSLLFRISGIVEQMQFFEQLGEAFGTIFDNVSRGLEAFITVFKANLEPAISNLVGVLAEEAPVFLEFLINVGGWIAKLSELLIPLGATAGNILGLVLGQGLKILGVLIKIASGIAQAFNLMSEEGGLVDVTLKLLIGGAKDLFGFVNNIVDAMRSVSDLLLNGLAPIAERLGVIIGLTIQTAILAISLALRGIGKILKEVLEFVLGIPGAIAAEWEGIVTAVQLSTALIASIPGKITEIIFALGGVANYLGGAFEDFIRAIYTGFFRDIETWIYENFKASIIFIEEQSSALLASIVTWFTETLPNSVGGFFGGIGEKLEGVKTAVSEFFFGTNEQLVASLPGSIGVLEVSSQGFIERTQSRLSTFWAESMLKLEGIGLYIQEQFNEKVVGTLQNIYFEVTGIFGAIAGWFTDTWGAIIETATGLLTGKIAFTWENIQAIFSGVVEWWSNTLTSIVNFAFDYIGGSILNISTSIANLFGIPTEWLTDTLLGLLDNARNVVLSSIQFVTDTINLLFERIGGWFVETWTSIIETATGLLTGKIAFTWENVLGIFTGITDWMSNTLTSIVSFSFEFISGIILNIGNAITNMFGIPTTWLTETIVGLLDNARDFILTSIQTIADFINLVFESIGTWFVETWTAIITTAHGLVTGKIALTWENIQGIFNGVVDWFTNTWTEIVSTAYNLVIATVQAIGELITSWFTFVVTWFTDTLTNTVNFFSDLAISIIQGIGNLVSEWFGFTDTWFVETLTSHINNARDFLINGIQAVGEFLNEWFTFIVNWITETLTGTLTAFRDFFINSINLVGEFIKGWVEWWWEWITVTIPEGLKQLYDNVVAWVKSVGEFISDWFDYFWEWITVTLPNAVKEIYDKVVAWIKSAAEFIWDWIKYIWEQLNNFWKSMSEWFEWLRDFILIELKEKALGAIYEGAKNIKNMFTSWMEPLQNAYKTVMAIGQQAAAVAGGLVGGVTGAFTGGGDSPKGANVDAIKAALSGRPVVTASNEGIFNQSGLGNALVTTIKAFENFYPKSYADGEQESIGFGTKAKYVGETITKEAANVRLRDELLKAKREVEAIVVKGYGRKLNQAQMDALTSFAYNLGGGKLRKLFDNGRRSNATVAEKIKLYNKANLFDGKGMRVLEGLKIRRDFESDMFKGKHGGVGVVQQAKNAVGGAVSNVTNAVGGAANKVGGAIGNLTDALGNFIMGSASASTGGTVGGSSISLPNMRSNTLPGMQAFGSPRAGGTRKHAGFDTDHANDATSKVVATLGGEIIRVASQRNSAGQLTGYGNYIDIYNKALGVVERVAEFDRGVFSASDVGKQVKAGARVGSGTTFRGVDHREIREIDKYRSSPFGYSSAKDPAAYLEGLGLYKLNSQGSLIATGKSITQQVRSGYGGAVDTIQQATEISSKVLQSIGSTISTQAIADFTEKLALTLSDIELAKLSSSEGAGDAMTQAESIINDFTNKTGISLSTGTLVDLTDKLAQAIANTTGIDLMQHDHNHDAQMPEHAQSHDGLINQEKQHLTTHAKYEQDMDSVMLKMVELLTSIGTSLNTIASFATMIEEYVKPVADMANVAVQKANEQYSKLATDSTSSDQRDSASEMMTNLYSALSGRVAAMFPSVSQEMLGEKVNGLFGATREGFNKLLGDRVQFNIQFAPQNFKFSFNGSTGGGTTGEGDRYITESELKRQLGELENYLNSPGYTSSVSNQTLETLRRDPGARNYYLE